MNKKERIKLAQAETLREAIKNIDDREDIKKDLKKLEIDKFVNKRRGKNESKFNNKKRNS